MNLTTPDDPAGSTRDDARVAPRPDGFDAGGTGRQLESAQRVRPYGGETIMNNALKDLARCADVGSLGSELRTLCSEFGSVSRLDILTMTDSGKRQAVCLLRLASSEQEQALMTKLGAGRFGDDLCVVVDLRTPDRAQV